MPETEKTICSKNGDIISYKISHCGDSSNENLTEKKAIVLIHGLASNMTRWTEFIENTSLSSSVELLRLDLKGHGKSMSYKRISTKDWCTDVKQIVDEEHYSKVIIVGHSLGAKIAIQFAYDYPEYSNGLIFIDPIFPKAIKGVLNSVRYFRYLLLGIIYILLLKAKMGFIKKNLPYRDLFELDKKTRAYLSSQSDGNIAKLYMNPFEDLIYIPFVNYCQDMFEVTRKIPELQKIKCAVLCLLSRGATISNIKITKSTINQFPVNEIEVIDADHWLLTEKPIESRHAIEKWCEKTLIACK